MRSLRLLRFREHAGVRLLHHLLAEIDPDQIVLIEVVVEHVFGGFTEVGDPFAHVRRPDAERHVLRVAGAGRMVVTADAADAAGNEMRVARVFAFHENAVAAKDRGRAVAFGDLAIGEIDLRINSEAAHDPGNRIPIHFDEAALRTLASKRQRRSLWPCVMSPVLCVSKLSSKLAADNRW